MSISKRVHKVYAFKSAVVSASIPGTMIRSERYKDD